jgi:3-oxoacyl-[acyl-carrier protein] reductase
MLALRSCQLCLVVIWEIHPRNHSGIWRKQNAKKNFVVIGGSSGIGLDIARHLTQSNRRVTVFSRSMPAINELQAVNHIPIDITNDDIDESSLPDQIQGLLYCPGSIRLRPFHRLKAEDFLADFEINLLGAVKAMQACLPGLK